MQADPPPLPAPPIDVHIDLSGLAGLIWQWLLDHLDVVGGAVWGGIKANLPDIGQSIWTPLSAWLEAGLRASAEATWNSMFLAIPQLLFQLPPALTYNLPAYRAIALDPVSVAIGGTTLALVLLGLRTLLGAMVGRDHVITHVTGRLIPAAAMAGGYVVLVVQAVGLINAIGAGVGPQAFAGMLAFPSSPNPALLLPYVIVWLLLIYFAIRLMIRLGYGLYRFLIALVFGPVALILWAIPQAEWVTGFWVREFVGWGTTPLLVAVSLAMAVPFAAGQAGFLGAALFGIAGLQVAHDVVGLLASSRGGGGTGLGSLLGYARMAAAAAAGGGAGVAAASAPAIRPSMLADQYGYQ